MTEGTVPTTFQGQPVLWLWKSMGWSDKAFRVAVGVGIAMLVVGPLLWISAAFAATVAGSVLVAVGFVVVLAVVTTRFGRTALVLRPDGTLELHKRHQCTRSVPAGSLPEIVMARTITHRTVNRNGRRQDATTEYLCIAPATELGRIHAGEAPPLDLLVLPRFPAEHDPDLRAALEQFTKVQIVG